MPAGLAGAGRDGGNLPPRFMAWTPISVRDQGSKPWAYIRDRPEIRTLGAKRHHPSRWGQRNPGKAVELANRGRTSGGGAFNPAPCDAPAVRSLRAVANRSPAASHGPTLSRGCPTF